MPASRSPSSLPPWRGSPLISPSLIKSVVPSILVQSSRPVRGHGTRVWCRVWLRSSVHTHRIRHVAFDASLSVCGAVSVCDGGWCGVAALRSLSARIPGPPELSEWEKRAFSIPMDLPWSSPESGELRYKSRDTKQTSSFTSEGRIALGMWRNDVEQAGDSMGRGSGTATRAGRCGWSGYDRARSLRTHAGERRRWSTHQDSEVDLNVSNSANRCF